MTTWTATCRLDDILPLGARHVARPQGLAMAAVRTADERVLALLDCCPHKGGPRSQGIGLGDAVACPRHNSTIGLADGCARPTKAAQPPVPANKWTTRFTSMPMNWSATRWTCPCRSPEPAARPAPEPEPDFIPHRPSGRNLQPGAHLAMTDTGSTCPYCGVGCGVIIEGDGLQTTGVRGNPEHPANFGRLCSKGATRQLCGQPTAI